MYTLIIDIDGTIADASHRLHHIKRTPKDWNAFYEGMAEDEPIYLVANVINSFYADQKPNVYIVTGRPERYREVTMEWLDRHFAWGSYRNEYERPLVIDKLLMRKDGDYRPDYIIKNELTSFLVPSTFNTVLVFEDRARVVQMWRERGFTVFQTAEGNY